MPAPAPRLEILHRCLSDLRPSSPLAAASLSDRERLGLLLEGCALDAHLTRIGRRPAGWEGARVCSHRRLVAVTGIALSSDPSPANTAVERALSLLRQLFADSEAPARGEGRQIARDLTRRWTLYQAAVGPDQLVADLLEHAPFLWRPRFAAYRESLGALLRDDFGGARLSVAGPAPFRRRALGRARELPALVALLQGAEAWTLWRGDPSSPDGRARSSDPRSIVATTPGPDPGANRSMLDRLIALSRVGRWRAVILEAERLRREGFDGGIEVEIARRAIEACLHLWRFERASEWAVYATRRASDAGEARLLAAWVEWESRPPESPARSAAGRRPDGGEPPPVSGSVESVLLWSRIEAENRPMAVVERLSAALRDRSRAAPADRGRLWLELGRARGIAAERLADEGPLGESRFGAASSAVNLVAERPDAMRRVERGSVVRAFTHALRHLRRGDHRVELWRGAAALLAERVRRGDLARAELVAACLGDEARAAGDRRRELAAAVIALEVEAARGDADRAAVASRVLLDRLPASCRDRARAELEKLLAKGRPGEAQRSSGDVAPASHPLDRAPAPRRAGRDAAPALPIEDRGGWVGDSAALHDALRRLERLARGDLPVLLCGETGTGKELAAKRLHERSPRRDRAFVAVNCAALSESLLLSELFGHARGAFTGADRERAGVFETAHGGTVFLDEIGDLPSGAQGALLRVLQEGEVRRVGESKARRVDVRIVAATHRDLDALVERGTFRQDLYYRLNVAVVRLPALRDRGEDVLQLARHFLAAHDRDLRFARDAEDLLLACSWPGNVRELRSVVQVAAAMHDGGGWIHARDLELPRAPRAGASYHGALDAERRRLLGEALSAAGGRRAVAAKRLGITPQAVSYLVRRLGLETG